MPPLPKPRATRQNRIKRPELGLVDAERAEYVIPTPPAGLTKYARQRWEAFFSSPPAAAIDLRADLHRLERWIRAVDEYERVGRVFRKARTVNGSMGQPVLNPLAAYLATREAEIARAEAELGMTPMARVKLGIAYGQAKLTAAELNKALDASSHTDADPDDEWEEA